MIKSKIKYLLILLPMLLTMQSANADGMASVKIFYEQTQAMRATFHQVVTDRQGRKVQEVDGEMQLKRPNKFRWDYNQPFEQQIISDGKQVWLYDIDLAQVTVRALGKALGSSPAALLAGGNDIDKSFKLANAPAKGGLDWVSANPKDKESGFEKILLGFKDNKLQEMSLIDSFGHNTKIVFSQLEVNPVLDDKSFLFLPPKGVDIVGE
ncbi:MAG: outer membrane lipoprotein chaperone LolA [Methylotenera sp.]|nr:outer membrane lipoprotein chaperone LolA [Methylotenera sp.]MDD4925395.1 outer membrane lipoprotein chaperone LolA [Methylotenera sp.]NOS95301.1 outer membrane lipoprotein chaperone LolA [Methylotenera sp.]